ncbi:MAG: hypothetical protein CL445_02415 [Acidimicrobiaceae bacterium]|nr:hypothetical protein [Acidimicrobiaceae bacterium]
MAGGAMIATASTSMAQGAPSIGEPTNVTVTVDHYNGTVKVDWDAPTGGTVDPERYAISFALDDVGTDPAEIVMDHGVTTGNVGDAGALDTEYTLTADVIEDNGVVHGWFSVTVRSDNDTEGVYSNETDFVSVEIINMPDVVDNQAYERDDATGDLTFSWDASSDGFIDPAYYRIVWGNNPTGVDGGTAQITSTSYTVDYEEVGDGTWFFHIYACGPTGDCHIGEPMEIAVSEGTPQTTELPATGSSNGLVIYVLLLLTGGGLLALSARHRPRGHA